MFKLKKPPSDYRILKLRDYEDKLANLHRDCKTNAHAKANARWEQITDNKIAKNAVMRKFEDLKARHDEKLDERREKLAKKLYNEEKSLQAELLAMEETPSERRAKLAERARSLQEARESERQKIAAELRERHFRENCDPLREKHSQKILQRTIEERNEQLEQQNLRHMWDVEERRMYDEMYELECLKIEQRYLEDLRKSGASKAEMQRILDRQVRDIARRRAEEDEMEASDIRKLQDTWRREEEDSRAREQAAKEATMRANADNTAFNRSLEEMRRQQQLQQKQDDFDFVQSVLEREARDAQKEEEFRDRQRESLRKWATNLAALRHKEAEDNAAQDAFIQRYQDSIQAREDAKKKAEDDARAALMQEVMDARARQIQERMAARQQELLDELAERQRMIEEAALMADLEEKYKHQKRRDALRQRLEIQSQIVAKAQRHAAEEMERLLALENAQKMEEAYMGKVDVAAQHEPQRWHGHKRVEWFH